MVRKALRFGFAIGLLGATAAACGDAGGTGTPADDIGQSRDALVVCADGPTVKGVDVSHYQGNIDWTKVKNAGYKFAIIKATEGTGYTDPNFKSNWSKAKSAGLVRGAYHFFRANLDGKAQAKHFAAVIGTLGQTDLPAVLDLETQDGVSDSTVISRAKAFLSELESLTKKTPIIYSGYFFTSLGSPSGFAKYPLWVPNWGVSCPNIPNAGWKKWKFWQFTDHQSVPGISGGVDGDRFNGTLADLQAFAKGPDHAVEGVLETATCDKITGWAWDPDTPAKALDVELRMDGNHSTGQLVATVKANQTKQSLCKPLGDCDHGFTLTKSVVPEDGKQHTIRAYATGDAGGAVALEGGALSVTCEAAEPPPTGEAGAGAGGAGGESAGAGGEAGGAEELGGSGGVGGTAGESAQTTSVEAIDEDSGCSIRSGNDDDGGGAWLVGLGLAAMASRRRAVKARGQNAARPGLRCR